MAPHRWMNKQNMMHMYNGIFFSCKEKYYLIWWKMDVSGKQFYKWDGPDSVKQNYVCSLLYADSIF